MITLSATITKSDGTLINLDYRNSISLERSIFDRSDLQLPSFGIISNNGKLKFIDSDSSIKRFAENRQLKSGMEVNFYLENTITNAKSQIGKFLTNEWDYDDDNRRVEVVIKDELEDWQNLTINPTVYNMVASKETAEINGKQLYDILINKMSELGYDINKFEIDQNTEEHLQKFLIPFPYIKEQSAWKVWNNFCIALQVHIYINNNNKIVCRYNGGN